MHDELRQKRMVGQRQRLPVAGKSLGIRLETVLIPQVRDAPVPKLDEVLHGREAGAQVVDHYAVGELIRVVAIDQDNRDLQLAKQRHIKRPDA